MTTEIRRSTARFVDRGDGRVTYHAFSFGPHYDPEALAFGPMVCHDDHTLRRGTGFDTHRHAGLDIVTWVASGAVEHTDSTGETHRVPAGSVAHLHAGDGVDHAETAVEPLTRFVQVWLTPTTSDDAADPDRPDVPTYAVRAVDPADLDGGALTTVLELPGARLAIARLEAGQELVLPEAARVHAYLVRGALTRSSLAEPLAAGDAFLLVDEPAHAVTTTLPTEFLVWTFDDGAADDDDVAAAPATAPPV